LRVIFGIGNPGIRYEFTRHNAGFLLLDYLAKKKLLNFQASTGEYLEAAGKLSDQNFVIVKPVTFVNNSGLAAKQIFKKYNLLPEEFLVICDDTNLKNFKWRVRLSGGDGGHNGLSSLIYHLMSDQFPRIRIGIGTNPTDTILSDYVLSDFSKDELEEYISTFKKCSILIEEFIVGGSKKMLEANSILMKSENQNNLNQ
jgi:peptidyl-tRNA hydrolase, PTH1 family